MDCIHSLRTQALPSNTISYKPEVLIVPPILPLSLYVLLQQWARPHIRRSGKSRSWPILSATKLLTLLLLLVSSQHCLLFSKNRPSLLPMTPPPKILGPLLLFFSKNRLLILSSSSPLASSKSFFQFSNAVPFPPLRPQPCHLHKSSSINASRHAQFYTHHTAQKTRQPCISMQQWWGAVTTSRLMQLCLKSRIRSDYTLVRQPPFTLQTHLGIYFYVYVFQSQLKRIFESLKNLVLV